MTKEINAFNYLPGEASLLSTVVNKFLNDKDAEGKQKHVEIFAKVVTGLSQDELKAVAGIKTDNKTDHNASSRWGWFTKTVAEATAKATLISGTVKLTNIALTHGLPDIQALKTDLKRPIQDLDRSQLAEAKTQALLLNTDGFSNLQRMFQDKLASMAAANATPSPVAQPIIDPIKAASRTSLIGRGEEKTIPTPDKRNERTASSLSEAKSIGVVSTTSQEASPPSLPLQTPKIETAPPESQQFEANKSASKNVLSPDISTVPSEPKLSIHRNESLSAKVASGRLDSIPAGAIPNQDRTFSLDSSSYPTGIDGFSKTDSLTGRASVSPDIKMVPSKPEASVYGNELLSAKSSSVKVDSINAVPVSNQDKDPKKSLSGSSYYSTDINGVPNTHSLTGEASASHPFISNTPAERSLANSFSDKNLQIAQKVEEARYDSLESVAKDGLKERTPSISSLSLRKSDLFRDFSGIAPHGFNQESLSSLTSTTPATSVTPSVTQIPPSVPFQRKDRTSAQDIRRANVETMGLPLTQEISFPSNSKLSAQDIRRTNVASMGLPLTQEIPPLFQGLSTASQPKLSIGVTRENQIAPSINTQDGINPQVLNQTTLATSKNTAIIHDPASGTGAYQNAAAAFESIPTAAPQTKLPKHSRDEIKDRIEFGTYSSTQILYKSSHPKKVLGITVRNHHQFSETPDANAKSVTAREAVQSKKKRVWNNFRRSTAVQATTKAAKYALVNGFSHVSPIPIPSERGR